MTDKEKQEAIAWLNEYCDMQALANLRIVNRPKPKTENK